MNPFSQPKNYDEMLTKIMIFTFVMCLIFVALVAHIWPALWNLLHPDWLTLKVDVLGLKDIPAAYIIVAAIISLAARVSKLHDRVSDVFGIRQRFDISEILTPLAGGVGVPVDLARREKLIANRRAIMGDVFYKYASSTNPEIDTHLIWSALDKWSWFWICIEGTTVALIADVALVLRHSFQIGAYVGIAMFVGTLVATQVNRACSSLAHSEVREILKDPKRCADIKLAFDAL